MEGRQSLSAAADVVRVSCRAGAPPAKMPVVAGIGDAGGLARGNLFVTGINDLIHSRNQWVTTELVLIA